MTMEIEQSQESQKEQKEQKRIEINELSKLDSHIERNRTNGQVLRRKMSCLFTFPKISCSQKETYKKKVFLNVSFAFIVMNTINEYYPILQQRRNKNFVFFIQILIKIFFCI